MVKREIIIKLGIAAAVLAMAFLFNTIPATAIAAPASGQIFQLTQPDGTKVNVRIWGDEFYQVVESLDGDTLVRDPQTKKICYANLSSDGKQLVSSGRVISAHRPKDLKVGRHIRIPRQESDFRIKTKRELFKHNEAVAEKKAKAMRRNRSQNSKTTYSISSGAMYGPGDVTAGDVILAGPPTPRITNITKTIGYRQGLTLIVDFTDQVATVPRDNIEKFCNQVGYRGYSNNGSVRDYFYDISGGKLIYTNYVPPAYYRAKNNKTYYDNASQNCQIGAIALITEALTSLKNNGFDFSPYDTDSDGYLDAVNLLYAGKCTSGWTMGLWPHSGRSDPVSGIPGAKYQITAIDTGPTLGTFCHENGHLICNFPDLYDYSFVGAGLGKYCLMAYGLDYSQTNPMPPCPFLKKQAGWATISDLVPEETKNNISTVPGVNSYYRVHNPLLKTEYYLISGIRQSVRETGSPDTGLSLLHIDELYSNDWPGHYGKKLIQADNLGHLEKNTNKGDANDLYFTGGESSPATSPNTSWWSGLSSNLRISDINAAGTAMTAIYNNYPIDIQPLDDVNTSGPLGGPFTFEKTYTLVNTDIAVHTWSASATSTWLKLSKSSGTLNPGESDTIVVSIDQSATTVAAGTYTDKITLTDTTGNITQQRLATFTIRPLAKFSLSAVGSPQKANTPFTVNIKAEDTTGSLINQFAGFVNLVGIVPTSQITVGTGDNTWAGAPMGNTTYVSARKQSIYLANQLAGAGTIYSLSIYVEEAPAYPTSNWTIRMKHTTQSGYADNGSTSGSFDNTSWTTVYYNNAESITQTGWVTFNFSTPFEYNGTSNLMVDFSYYKTTLGNGGYGRSTYTTDLRAISASNYVGAGDPSTWTTGNKINSVVDLILYKGNTIAITPSATSVFSNGEWTGSVTVPTAASSIFINCKNSNIGGKSNNFVVE